ncbi:MAG: hypothetical protein JGK24_22315 [Microcoleus sp. PH2017_29_MFU_D_A]|uniref:hypothetical protein n=1 Tax=unclassified Microcoleus TaxID=2642155 RepID=UPI001D6FC6DB|nr:MULTISPECIES: hypothetical protein [unclassified Microcoleus]MCC3418228.1 hypothetical protein [Microcoleus sp. PH2017_07_MST_O_A]MCC3506552.1 hypothetical protein [Microcoleus sp. PH2017_19_SFW_U_A]MCC3508633.1 hypothetical protein [Microcoleus sp. PH2017_17_BER_D_A]MCC3425073.1 hypothetical protein [Microcoleus sp. PH2017_01_SCD_O_A]MCC3439411.1 hypothetical protein [Microcoleus sp. PH2017_05_CCC_O_A]
MSESLSKSINTLLAAQKSRCELEYLTSIRPVNNKYGVIWYWSIDGAEPVDVDNTFATVEEAIASLIQYLETFVPPKEDDDDEDNDDDEYEYEY